MDSTWFGPTARSSSMGVAALAFAWESTPLGAMSTWGEALRQTARLCFSTRFPVLIAWGPDLTMIYNDAYREMLGTHKRLTALGAPLAHVWVELWEDIGPLVDQVMTTRLPTWAEDTPLMMNRSGFLEETYFTFSYSPLVDDFGEVVGVLDIATETTAQVVSRRRLVLIDSLHADLYQADSTPAALGQVAASTLSGSQDISRCAVLVRSTGTAGLEVAGDQELADEITGEVVRQVMSTRAPAVVGSTMVIPLAASDHDHGDAEGDGVLVVEAAPTRPFDAEMRAFAMLAASAVDAALRAARAQQAQVDYLAAHTRVLELEAARTREMSIALQHSLLTAPPEPDHLHVVVRYQPAARDLEIGGDWYDGFLTQDGATTLVIGDVTGHDHHAAAAMGQLRGLIRAIAFDSGQSPARVLERTDLAIRGLNLGDAATATTIVARIEQVPADEDSGLRTVRWSSAGHPYPILLRADGTVEVLDHPNGPPLGVLPDVQRTDHTVVMNPSDTLFLYTDGLVERRGTLLSESTDGLVDLLRGKHSMTLDELADHTLASLAPGRVPDDVALVLLRTFPEDRPRPAEAGEASLLPESGDLPAG